MTIALLILKVLLPAAYVVALGAYARAFFQEESESSRRAAQTAMAVALGLHTALLALLTIEYHRCPLWTQGEALLFLGWLLGLLHLLSEWSADTRRLGFFTLMPSALCAFPAIFFLGNDLSLAPELRSSWFIFHIVAALASYAAYSLAAVLAALYLLQYNKLKRKHFDRTFRRLPPLDKLDKLAAVWAFLGTVLMILSSVIGAWWVRRHGLYGMSIQEAGIFIVLAIYLMAAASRRTLGWRGRRHALWVLAGFAALVFANLWLHGFFRA
jgi:HemX protein